MFTTKFTKANNKRPRPLVRKFAEGGKVNSTEGVAGRKPLDVRGTWMDLEQASGPGSPNPTEAERRARGDPVKRSGYSRY